MPLFVAYNPYLPDAEQQAEERRRLRAKLLGSGGLVAGVYLQVREQALDSCFVPASYLHSQGFQRQ